LRAALTVADAILVPFQPRSVDLWVGEQIAALVSEARCLNEPLRAYALLNIADPQGRDNDDAAAALGKLDGMLALPAVVVRRKAFPNALQTPRDAKACGEILSVVDALYTQGADNDHQRAA
jgi:chromosome partitioning protein